MDVLSRVNNVSDLKKLKEDELILLCENIREFLVDAVAKTGGHLASNLGVVELTVAMHYVYDSPEDKFIFDVGHQAYVHKILTGRKNDFDTLRQYKGLSGFPKGEESVHDAFDTGHSATSISAGLGYALGRDLVGGKNKVISIIGDGALTGGMAYEALNHAGKSQTDILVVLNDNNMSISQNVGALSNNFSKLSKMRMSEAYNDAKVSTKNVLEHIFDGKHVEKAITRTKNRIRRVVLNGSGFFEDLGFKYYGKVDGNDVVELVRMFRFLKEQKQPILLHIDTKKGLGYKYSEENPEAFHGTPKFDKETGSTSKSAGVSYSNCFGNKLVEMAGKNGKVVAITAAMASGTGLNQFAKAHKNRFFDVGIAEQHAITFASAISKTGYIPYVALYSTFLQRAYDQVIHDVAITGQKMVICIDRAGLVGEDGETHQGVFDIGMLLNIPNFVVMSPANGQELEEMLELTLDINSPMAIRYPRGNTPDFDYEHTKVEFGKASTIVEGEETAIVAVGNMVEVAVAVSKELEKQGKKITIINPRFLKPVDENLVKGLKDYKNIICLEDGQRINGFGSYLQVLLNEENVNKKIMMLGYEDRFTNQGSVTQLRAEHNLDTKSLVEKIINL